MIMPRLKESCLGNKRWFQLLMPGICVNVALFPIQLWYYYEFPLYSMLLNIIVVPLMSVLLVAGMFGSIFSMFSGICGKMCLLPCRWIFLLYEMLGEWALKLPAARVVTGQPELWKILMYYVIVIFILWKGINRKRMIMYILCVCTFVITPTWKFQITMLDVGQGDCIFIKGPKDFNCLVDGGSSDVKEVGKNRIEPFLKQQGVGTLDYVFVSHGDYDHCSGIEEMLQRQELGVKINNLVVPSNYEADEKLLSLIQIAKDNRVQVLVMDAGITVKRGNVTILCLQPTENATSGNASSMVLDLNYKNFNVLFTGDVEKEGEDTLAKSVDGKVYSVLKVSHHGSKYSTEEEFLNAIDAKVALISAGENNSYGHPHEETLERLQKENAIIYETTNSGAITITTEGKKMGIKVFH